MKITLIIDGQEKEFRTKFISGRMFRKAIKLQKQFQDTSVDTEEKYDELIAFCIEAFSNQFTEDEFLDGISSSSMMITLVNTVLFCINGKIPSNQKEEVQEDTH